MIDGTPVDTEHEAKSHGEHIIHNAIGGHLISHNILCEKCGGDYSKDDAAFTEIFQSFLLLLNQSGKLRKLDCDNLDHLKVNGEIFTSKDLKSDPLYEILFQNGKATPRSYFYQVHDDTKVVDVFCSKRGYKGYLPHVKSDLEKDGKDSDIYKFILHSDTLIWQ